jgi:hypothetical protein
VTAAHCEILSRLCALHQCSKNRKRSDEIFHLAFKMSNILLSYYINHFDSMKNRLFGVVLVFVCLLIQPASAQWSGWGIGLSFGEPTGFAFKKWIDEEHAVTGGVAYSVATIYDGLSMNVNYVWNKYQMANYQNNFGFHYGAGVRFNTRSAEGSQFGLRGTVEGIWYPEHFPCDFFLEAAPVLLIAPSLSLAMDVNAGVRFYLDSFHGR